MSCKGAGTTSRKSETVHVIPIADITPCRPQTTLIGDQFHLPKLLRGAGVSTALLRSMSPLQIEKHSGCPFPVSVLMHRGGPLVWPLWMKAVAEGEGFRASPLE
jgi:hypothetical protein